MSVFCSHTLVVGSPPATQTPYACLTMDDGSSDEVYRYESEGRCYEWTSDTFTELERWEAKTSGEDEFVFVLHDLVLDHMLLPTQTLQVAVFVDVEDSGYFPGKMQQWKFDRAAQESLYRDEALARSYINLLS
jgi:hypothetical protein